MVKAFVELHHGKVMLTSAPGDGTTVVCRFPVNAETLTGVTIGQKVA